MVRRSVSSSMSRSRSSSKSDNSYIYVIIGVFLFAVVIGTIIATQRGGMKELFSNEKSMGKLVYLYMNGCPHCDDFNKNWNEITAEINKNKEMYKFETAKFNLSTEGEELAKENNIDYAPAILFVNSNGKANVYEGKTRQKDEILKWVLSLK
jgi:hypothetical protein